MTLRGLTTVGFRAADLQAANRWYSDLLGIEPYFQMPGYVEFRIGDYQHELGIIDTAYLEPRAMSASRASQPGGAVVYWHVDDVPATLQRLQAMGAQILEAAQDFGHGFIAASVVDPFGNILGVMYNPHYVEVLSTQGRPA